MLVRFNPLKTSPKYTRAAVYGKCVLQQNQIIFNGLTRNNAALFKPAPFMVEVVHNFV